MKSFFSQAFFFAAIAALASAAPLQAGSVIESRAVKGPVIFLSNCFNSKGGAYGEFEYYDDAANSVLNKKSSAPTLTNVINSASDVSFTQGGTFVTVGQAQEFDAIFSIDEDKFTGPGAKVGNGKSTSYFYAQICYEMASSTVYSPSASVKCSSRIYCVPGPADN